MKIYDGPSISVVISENNNSRDFKICIKYVLSYYIIDLHDNRKVYFNLTDLRFNYFLNAMIYLTYQIKKSHAERTTNKFSPPVFK